MGRVCFSLRGESAGGAERAGASGSSCPRGRDAPVPSAGKAGPGCAQAGRGSRKIGNNAPQKGLETQPWPRARNVPLLPALLALGVIPKSAPEGLKSPGDGHGIGVASAVLECLDWMVFEGFSNLNDPRFYGTAAISTRLIPHPSLPSLHSPHTARCAFVPAALRGLQDTLPCGG